MGYPQYPRYGRIAALLAGLATAILAGGAAQATTVQTFDGGGTNYTGVQHNSAPGPIVTAGGPTGSFLRVANDNVGNQANTVAFDRTWVGGFTRVRAVFDFRMGGAGNGADGLAFALLNTANFGATGGLGSSFSEEPNLAGSLGVGFDTHDNGAQDLSEDSVSLHHNGAKVAEVDLTGLIDLENNLFNRAEIEVIPQVGGSLVSLTVTPDIHGTPGAPIQAFDDVFVAGLVPYEARAAFAARTGGLNDNHDVDNVSIQFDVPEPGTLLLSALGVPALAAFVRRRRRRA